MIQIIVKIAEDVQNGSIDPLKAYLDLKSIESELKNAFAIVQDLAINEAQKYPKTFQFHGYEVQNKSGAGRWDFKHISDWNNKKRELDEVEEKHKLAFKMAEKGDTYITEGGEVIEPAFYIPGKDTIAVKLLK